MKKLISTLFAAALIPTISWGASCPRLGGNFACINPDTQEAFELKVTESQVNGIAAFAFESTPLMMKAIADNKTYATNNWDDEVHQSSCRFDALIVRQQFNANGKQIEIWKKTTVRKSSTGDLKIKQRVETRWNGVDLENMYQSWDCSAI